MRLKINFSSGESSGEWEEEAGWRPSGNFRKSDENWKGDSEGEKEAREKEQTGTNENIRQG